MIRTELIHGVAGLEKLRSEWQELTSDSLTATPFQLWDWHNLWFKHYGFGKKLRIFTIREGNDLIGIAPFVTFNGPWKSLRWSGGGPSDYLHPIARTGKEQFVDEASSNHVKETKDVDFVDLHQIRESLPFASGMNADEKIDQATCLVLDLPDSFDEYLKTLGKSLRYDVKKLDKDLFLSGRASMQPVPEAEASQGFEVFLEQHRLRWKERKLPGAFVGPSLKFHREWIPVAAKNGWLRLKLLQHEGQTAGAIYAMQFNRVLYYYQAGFDPAHKAISPGTLLVAQSIRTGIEEGVKTFDFMRGDEPYKRRWKPQHEYHNLRFLFVNRPLRGTPALGWNKFANRIELKIRSRLEGGGGC